jgi:hypothetical protein
LGEAVVDADAAGGATSCRRLEGKVELLSRERWPAALSGIGMDKFEALADGLDSQTENVAALYAAGQPLSGVQAAQAQVYGQTFRKMAEPALAAYYYRLNPDFWEWLRRQGAPSLPKPN